MNVIFLSSLYANYPAISRYIGPYQLSHQLRNHGYTCQVIDFIIPTADQALEEQTLFDLVKKFIKDDTLMVGVSSTFFLGIPFPENIIECIKRIRVEFPKVKLVLGGNLAGYYLPAITDLFDSVVIGYAEDILLELVNFYKTGVDEPIGIKELPHKTKIYRKANLQKFSIEECRHRWHPDDCIQPNETLPLEISRGCIFKCKFCSYPLLGRTKNDYTRSMQCIREELIDNYNQFGTTNYFLLDDTFNETVEKVTAFHDMVKSLPFSINYCAYIRADLLHRFPETIKLLKDSGLKGAFFGIESFHPAMSKMVGKAWSGKHAKTFLPTLVNEHWNREVLCYASMIVGLADKNTYESVEELRQSKKWLVKHHIPHRFVPLGLNNIQNEFSSVFTRNSEDYGYYHPENKLKDTQWAHRTAPWTRSIAVEISNELQSDHTVPGVSGWGAFSFLSTGYQWQEIVDYVYSGINPNKFTRNEVKKRSDIWLEGYFQTLKNKKDS